MVSSTPRSHFTPAKDPVPIVKEAWWTPGLVWTGGKSLLHRDSIPDRRARSQFLYRLSYRAHTMKHILSDNTLVCMRQIKSKGKYSGRSHEEHILYLHVPSQKHEREKIMMDWASLHHRCTALLKDCNNYTNVLSTQVQCMSLHCEE